MLISLEHVLKVLLAVMYSFSFLFFSLTKEKNIYKVIHPVLQQADKVLLCNGDSFLE